MRDTRNIHETDDSLFEFWVSEEGNDPFDIQDRKELKVALTLLRREGK